MIPTPVTEKPLCAADMQPGHTYVVNHCRKGILTMHVTGGDDVWVSGTFLDGEYRVLNKLNAREHGDEITVRRSLISTVKEAQ